MIVNRWLAKWQDIYSQRTLKLESNLKLAAGLPIHTIFAADAFVPRLDFVSPKLKWEIFKKLYNIITFFSGI